MAASTEQPPNIDILLWADQFWCFREEFTAAFKRKDDYRVVLQGSEEWSDLTDERHRDTGRLGPGASIEHRRPPQRIVWPGH